MESRPASSQPVVKHSDPSPELQQPSAPVLGTGPVGSFNSHRSCASWAAVYAIALALGLLAGWINQKVNDPLLTSLCVVAFSMFMGVWKKQRPWRWLVLVWIGVPLVLAYYQFVVHWPHNRGEVAAAFLQVLAASAGAHGGHFLRQAIERVFLQQDE